MFAHLKPVDDRCYQQIRKLEWARKSVQAARDRAIEAQLDQGVPLALALRIVDGVN